YERCVAVSNRHAAIGVVYVQRREQRGRAGIHGQAARIRSGEEISAQIFDPWRAARGVGKFVDVSVERGVVRGDRKLRRGHDQLPRLDRLWAEVYRLDQRRLGRETVCRSDERTRLRGENISVHRQEPRGRAGRELWRLHGQLAVRSHQSFQVHRVARWDVQYGIGLRNDGRALVPGMGIPGPAVETARALSEMVAAFIRREIQNTDASDP